MRKDTGEGYQEYIKRVTQEDEAAVAANSGDNNDGDPPAGKSSGSDDVNAETTPEPSTADKAPRKVTAEEAVRHDRKRKKTTSNDDWASCTDGDARITRMKNGTTRLAYKAEHVVDMETGAILAAEVLKGNEHDAATLESSLTAAEKNIAAAVGDDAAVDEPQGEAWHKQPIAEVVADKGYHKASVLLALQQRGYRTFIPEKKQRGRRKFTDKGGKAAAAAFHANRARTRRQKGKDHQRRRGELLERPNQHIYDRGDLRELTVIGQLNVKKRVVIQAAGFNLGLVMRKLVGAGTPKRLAAAFVAFLAAILAVLHRAAMKGRAKRHHHHNRFWWTPPAVTHGAAFGIRVSTSAC